ncbi:hypothetical protein ACWD7C_12890 [Streptomyces sp. NPDC005134]|uniref:hypothetical protein n=1 Tax=unclassified Streptomyces TaxID=2593676 RepID=UPI0033ACDE1E
MSEQPGQPPIRVGDVEFPHQLQEALRRMSARGPVVDQGAGEAVAENGRLVTDEPGEGLVACFECAPRRYPGP